MARRMTSPISALDFSRVVDLFRPPSGWSDLEPLIVANSGGPDSTCLLFLLRCYLDSLLRPFGNLKSHLFTNSAASFPTRLISLTIDHDLQPSSKEMAERAGNSAKTLGVEHATVKLPWGQNNFHPKPGPNDKIEGVARDMRYKVLFKYMRMRGATAVALGHHLDDQVETMLMRLSRGSSAHGLAAMKSCRRWGMGDSFARYGYEGMKNWIVRPLLPFDKGSILATCEEHKLDYFQDATNFQPELTLRNAIRHHLNRERSSSVIDNITYPEQVSYDLKRIQQAAEEAQPGFDLNSSLSHLRQQNQRIGAEVRQLEACVNSFVEKYRLPSPPGTFMVAATDLEKIESPSIRETLLFHVARHVSPEPWGHPRAELGRSKTGVKRLVDRLWPINKCNSSICVGSHVWWRPVTAKEGHVRPLANEGKVKFQLAWIAQRQPPERHNPHASVQHKIELNMEDLAKGVRKGTKEVEILYDMRFLIRINPRKLPQYIKMSLAIGGSLVIDSVRPWYIPEVKHRRRAPDTSELVHTHVAWPYEWRKTFGFTRDVVVSDWITIEFIRPITTL